MATRSYNSSVRKDAEAETWRRIVVATTELHAEKGAMATSHAEIAARAGVSVPTVYKHFPTRNALLPACIGMVSKDAPQIDAAAILAEPDADARLVRLVDAVYARYRYFHPWFRWTGADAPHLPEVAQAREEGRRHLQMLIREVLGKIAGRRIPREVMALAQALLDYCAWQRLCELLDKPEEANRAAAHALQLIISPLRK